MSKHTPGPWQTFHDHGWLVVASSNEDLYIKVEKGSAATERLADARLIAAAPELLEALQACIAKGSKWHPCDPVVLQARAAIIKATGEA